MAKRGVVQKRVVMKKPSHVSKRPSANVSKKPSQVSTKPSADAVEETIAKPGSDSLAPIMEKLR